MRYTSISGAWDRWSRCSLRYFRPSLEFYNDSLLPCPRLQRRIPFTRTPTKHALWWAQPVMEELNTLPSISKRHESLGRFRSAQNRWSYAVRWCDYDLDWGECLSDVTPISLERRALLDETLVVGVERPLSGQEKVSSLWAPKSSDAGENGEWEDGRLQSLQFLSPWWPRTSVCLLRLIDVTPGLS